MFMSASSAVDRAAQKLEYLLKTGINEALDGVRAELKAGQRELEDMQSTLREAEKKYNHDSTESRLLSVIKEYACNVEAAIDSDFIEFMTRRRSVFQKMVLVFCCNVDESEYRRLIYVLKNIGAIRDTYLALGLKCML
ncbi:hypothetical protein POM88_035217 [Heracleum sosnowskyi]|uniref:Disease resistance N-terminal domain-containing protein n=1 Tax=Heracleum sosnowskyi TaxID=360622 RepID=A0AAD8HKT2_9APIA|nr:hypothetical protein POM88_035217 [Heracleum sosnowskyi]